MIDRPTELVCAWIQAYYTHRDADMLALAHRDIEVRPRVGLGERLYTGLAELEEWLDFTRPTRAHIETYTTESLDDGRILGAATLDGQDVIALFEVTDDHIHRVTMFLSDRAMLEQIGRVGAQMAPAVPRVVAYPDDAPAT